MKRFFAIVFFVLTILSILAALAWCGYCTWDYRQMLLDPTLSGIDFLMVGAFYGIGIALICIVGAVSALVQSRLTDNENMQIFDYCAVGIFVLGMIFAAFLFFV